MLLSQCLNERQYGGSFVSRKWLQDLYNPAGRHHGIKLLLLFLFLVLALQCSSPFLEYALALQRLNLLPNLGALLLGSGQGLSLCLQLRQPRLALATN